MPTLESKYKPSHRSASLHSPEFSADACEQNTANCSAASGVRSANAGLVDCAAKTAEPGSDGLCLVLLFRRTSRPRGSALARLVSALHKI